MGQALPSFSVIVPTYARLRSLEACLQALARLDYPRERFEVILVDDGSVSSPKNLVDSLRGELAVTLMLQRHGGPAAARNAGATRATGDFLAFTDDDCAPASDWLKVLAAHVAISPDHALGGRTVNALASDPCASASQLLVAYLYSHYTTDSGMPRFFVSNNLAVPAGLFREVGGFDPSFPLAAGEDREFCDRWLHHGHRMTYVPEAIVYHAHALTFRAFWRQHFNYGRGAYHFHGVHARRSQVSIKLEPLSFYLDLLCYPLSRARGRRALLLAELIVVSQVANAAGFFWAYLSRSGERLQRKRQVDRHRRPTGGTS